MKNTTFKILKILNTTKAKILYKNLSVPQFLNLHNDTYCLTLFYELINNNNKHIQHNFLPDTSNHFSFIPIYSFNPPPVL